MGQFTWPDKSNFDRILLHCAGSLSRPLFMLSEIYRVSQEERTKLREDVPYVKLYRYNPKHLYPKLNRYGDNGQRKVWTSCISAYCTSTAVTLTDQCSTHLCACTSSAQRDKIVFHYCRYSCAMYSAW